MEFLIEAHGLSKVYRNEAALTKALKQVSFIGGGIGIACGSLLSLGASFVLSKFLQVSWSFLFPIAAAWLGLAVSGGVGLIFGFFPARQAARKSPIEALRYE